MGPSLTKINVEQQSNIAINQQFYGTCGFSCNNSLSGNTILIKNSKISGGANFLQTCKTDANCTISANLDALADSVYQSKIDSVTKDAGLLKSDTTEINIYQNMRQSILQKAQVTCGVSSVNKIENNNIAIEDSQIAGGINFNQDAFSGGSCMLTNFLSASAKTLGQQQSKTVTGKNLISTEAIIIIIIILIVIGIIVYFFHKSTKGKKEDGSSASSSLLKAALFV
jgi:hypothetical protein